MSWVMNEPPAPAMPPAMPPPPPVPPVASRVAGWSPPLDPAPLRLVLFALAGGLAFDVGIRGGLDNVVVAVGVGVLVLALVTDRRLHRTEARWLAAAALLPALFLGLRSSPWVVASNLAAIVALGGVAVAQSRSGSLFDTSPLRLASRGSMALVRAIVGPLVLRRVAGGVSRHVTDKVARVALALVVAVPLLAIVVALLASADAVFAGLVSPDVELGPLPGHVLLAGFFAGGIVCVVAAALGDGPDDVPSGRFGGLEVAVMLGLTVAVLGLFVVAQLVALTDAGERLVEDAGLTPAEYARSGFFQLCWAAAFVLLLLAVVRALAAPEVMAQRGVRVMAAAVPALAVGLVVVSLQRMQLYDEAFGLTMLRLWVVLAAVLMGSVMVMIALRNLGVGGGRNWVTGATLASALVLTVGVNVFEVEAFVVRHNVARAADGADLDASYLSDLSDDAVPALVDALDEVPAGPERQTLLNHLRCHDDATGVAALNLSARRAADAREAAAITPITDELDPTATVPCFRSSATGR